MTFYQIAIFVAFATVIYFIFEYKIDKFLTLKEVLDLCTGFHKDYGVSIAINPQAIREHNCTASLLEDGGRKAIDFNLHILSLLIAKQRIKLYGKVHKLSKTMREVDLDTFKSETYINKANWSEDFSSLYKDGRLLYTDLCMNRRDVMRLLKDAKSEIINQN